MLKFLLQFGFAGLVLASPPGNLVDNGSFETPTISGANSPQYQYTLPDDWAGIGGGRVLIQSSSTAWGGLPAPEGDQYLGLQSNNGSPSAFVSQTVGGLCPDAYHTLTFYYASRPNSPGDAEAEALRVSLGGLAVDFVLQPTQTFVLGTIENFRPENETMDLVFTHVTRNNLDSTIFIDAVSVNTTTAPCPKPKKSYGGGSYGGSYNGNSRNSHRDSYGGGYSKSDSHGSYGGQTYLGGMFSDFFVDFGF